MERFQQLLVDNGYNIGNSGHKKDGVDGDIGKKTLAAAGQYVKDLCRVKELIFFPDNPYWFRTSDIFTDKFSDFCVNVNGGKAVSVIEATTKAGKYYVCNPLTVGGITGTGVVVEGQYIDSHEWVPKGKWGGGYFRQIKPILVYRDGNKDNKLDKNIVQKAPNWYTFFMHAMGKGFSIWDWSAGCLCSPLAQWLKGICSFYKPKQKVSMIIFEV